MKGNCAKRTGKGPTGGPSHERSAQFPFIQGSLWFTDWIEASQPPPGMPRQLSFTKWWPDGVHHTIAHRKEIMVFFMCIYLYFIYLFIKKKLKIARKSFNYHIGKIGRILINTLP